jgi:hypothetical protein
MTTLIEYVKQRRISMSLGFGRPNVRPLWLDALLYGSRRWLTLNSPWFMAWCRELDQVFRDDFDWPRSYVADTGPESWIDYYRSGSTPEEAAHEEASYWEG